MYIQFNITLTVKHVHVVISIQQSPVLKEQRKSKGLGILPYGTPKLVSAGGSLRVLWLLPPLKLVAMI
jgi:hypothetical protein